MKTFKLIISILLLIFGFTTAYLTYNLSNKDSLGYKYQPGDLPHKVVSVGIDSSNDGVAVGLGIISGFSFLSATLLLNSSKS